MNKRIKKKKRKQREKLARTRCHFISMKMDEAGVFENNIFEGVQIKGVWGPHEGS